jgi:hypothetical protein
VSGTQLAGTLDQAVVQRPRHRPQTVHVDEAVLTGTVIGNRLILSINGGAKIAGAFHGAQLVLDYPDPQHTTRVSGLLVSSLLVLTMQRTTGRAYHQALATLQRQVAVANATAQRSQQRARNLGGPGTRRSRA